MFFNAVYDDYTNRFSPRTEVYRNNDNGTRSYNLGNQTIDDTKEPSVYGSVNQKMRLGEAKLSGGYGEYYQQVSSGLSGSLTAAAYDDAAHQLLDHSLLTLFIKYSLNN